MTPSVETMMSSAGSTLPTVGVASQTTSVGVGVGVALAVQCGTNVVANGLASPTTSLDGLPSPQRRPGENRRSNKPIMEKRRRARINNCLNELKTLILDAMKKDPARHSKLEKADILEMTVKHLETLQRQQVAMTAASDPAVVNKFRAGFTECAGEVGRFPGLDSPVRRRLLTHLSNCLNGAGTPTSTSTETPSQSVQVHILPHPETQPPPQQNPSIYFSTTSGGLQLVPTRLPNGDIALVLPSGSTHQFRTTSPAPSSSSNSSSPLPMLIPIPQRTASSTSASSSTCSSPVAFERLTVSSRDRATSPVYERPSSEEYDGYEEEGPCSPMDKPISLVMRKRSEEIQDEDGVWRPW